MTLFKYTVANKTGKKLNGTIDSPDEVSARNELNNLGFSILQLQTLTEINVDKNENLQKFVFEALDKQSKQITGTIPSKDEEEAYKKLSREYDLIVTSIWKEGATDEEIAKAKITGIKKFQEALLQEEEELKKQESIKSLAQQKEEQFIKTKIELVLKKVNEILQEFDQDFDNEQKLEISKKINKLLRIKQSSNIEYVLSTAEDLLIYLQAQEKVLKEKGLKDKQISLAIRTKELLDQLKKSNKPESLSEDILSKIQTFEEKYSKTKNPFLKFIYKILINLKNLFQTPPEIQAIKELIKTYNKQLFNFALIYFKDPTPEYKEKIKNSIKTVWNERKKAKQDLKNTIEKLKEKQRLEDEKAGREPLYFVINKELCALTGWLLAFYITYYFLAIYLSTKDFELKTIPKGIVVYNSHFFKYILAIIFLLHAVTSLKINFFKNSFFANLLLVPIFILGSIIALLNF